MDQISNKPSSLRQRNKNIKKKKRDKTGRKKKQKNVVIRNDSYNNLRLFGVPERVIEIIDSYLETTLINLNLDELRIKYQTDAYRPLRFHGFSENIIIIIDSYLDKSLLVGYRPYDEEHKKYHRLYINMKNVLENYINYNIIIKIKGNVSNRKISDLDTVKYLLSRLPQLFQESNARATICLHSFGIYAPPPTMEFLQYLRKFIKHQNITHIVDYGAGTGLWSSILQRFFKKTNVYAYDKYPANQNNIIKKSIDFFPIQSTINWNEFPVNNTLLLLLFPDTELDMCNTVLKTFPGKYMIFQGDSVMADEKLFFHKLNKNWKIIKLFDTLCRLSILESKSISGLYLLKKKK